MIKVLIADDEPHFLKYMETVIDWEKRGFKICGRAKNGLEVLQLMQNKTSAQLALLDINMPGIGGLELAEQLKKQYPHLFIVFVTGYSEFEYARRALQLGAEAYLLKPFTKEELISIINKLQLKLHHKREETKQRKVDREIVQEEFLRRWVHGRSNVVKAELEKGLKQIHLTFPYSRYQICVWEIDNVANMRKRQADVELWKFAVANIVKECLVLEGVEHHLFYDYEDYLVSIINYKETEEFVNISVQIDKSLVTIRDYFDFTVSAGVGLEQVSTELVISYSQAMRALEEKFVVGGGNRKIIYGEIEKIERDADFYRFDVNQQLLSALRKCDSKEIQKIFRDTTTKIHEKKISIDQIYMIASGMLSICFSYITEMNGDIYEIYGGNFTPYSELYKMNSLQDTFSFLKTIFDKSMVAFQNTYSRRGIEIMEQVEKYMEIHYADTELSVEKLAADVFLDSSYVRRIVSRQRGCTVSDLLTSVRMEKAVELMKKEHLSIAELSEQVGYKEAGYFSKCFKKYFGISPKNYYNQRK